MTQGPPADRIRPFCERARRRRNHTPRGVGFKTFYTLIIEGRGDLLILAASKNHHHHSQKWLSQHPRALTRDLGGGLEMWSVRR